VPGITDRDAARALTGGRCVLTALGLVAALAGPWPGAVSRAEAGASDSLAVLDGRVVRQGPAEQVLTDTLWVELGGESNG